ncbi:MAG: methionine aminotransferase [Desulfobacterales bacterium]
MILPSKLPSVGLTIFTEMTNLANAHGAINLSQGFPEFDPHPLLQQLVSKHMRAGHNQYAPMQGVLALREKIAEKVREIYNAPYDPVTEVTVTAGATEALFAAVTAVVHPGDEVIILEPAYDCYIPMVTLNGGRPVFVPLNHPSYRVDWEALRRRITPRTRLAILNFPHNPSGAILEPRDLDRLAEMVRGTGILLLSDEVYEHIVFDGHSHCSLAGHPELRERTYVVSSFAKTYHATGWKVGYCLAPRPLSAEFQKVHQYLVFSVNTPIQQAFAEFIRDPAHVAGLAAHYQSLRDMLVGGLAGSRFRPLACHGTFFLMLDYSALSEEPDVEMARRLTRDHGVAAIPPSVFYHDGTDHRLLRVCFAKTRATLEEAARRLRRI